MLYTTVSAKANCQERFSLSPQRTQHTISAAPAPAVIIAGYKSIAITSLVFADYTEPFVLFTTRLRHVPPPARPRHAAAPRHQKTPIFGGEPEFIH